MSKIDELKLDIHRHEANISRGQSIIDSNKAPLESFKAQLAALEAESAKPREFQIRLGGFGNVVGCKSAVNDLSHFSKEITETITAREVRPVVVDNELAERMFAAWRSVAGVYNIQAGCVQALKAAGIDAVEG